MNKPPPIQHTAFVLILLLIAFLMVPSGYCQTTFSWTGLNATNANWGAISNWNPTAVPNSGNSAIITDASVRPEVVLNREATLTNLEIGSAITLIAQQLTNAHGLTISGTLTNAGLIDLRNSGNTGGLPNYLTVADSTLNNTGTILLTAANPGGDNRDATLNIAIGNENAGTISLLNTAGSSGAQNHDLTMNLTGAGTFTNAGSVNLVKTSSNATLTATIQGATATYAQSGGVTRVGGGAAVNVGAIVIHAGTLTGAGSVTGADGGVTIGDGTASGDAIVSANTISVADTTVSTNSDIATLSFGSSLTLNSDARFELDINISGASSVTSDLLNITGGVTLTGNPELVLNNLGGDIALNYGTSFTIIDYSITASGFFSYKGRKLPEGSRFTFGSNTFRINYGTAGTGVLLTVVPATTVADIMVQPHPRLLLSDQQLQEIQQIKDIDPSMANLLQVIHARAESYLNEPLIEFTENDSELLDRARIVLGRILTWCFEYRRTGDARFADAAKEELLNVSNASAFPKWFNNRFLRAAEMSLAVSIGYDWLYDVLTSEEKETIRNGLVRNALRHARAAYHTSGTGGGAGWHAFSTKPMAYNNHNLVNNGGYMAAALALCGELSPADSDLPQIVFCGVKESLPEAMQHFAPGGAWPEGPTYWAYGLTYAVLTLDMLENSFGTDFGLGEMPGFDRTIDFGLHVFGATGMAFDFADGGPGMDYALGGGAEMTWLTRRYGRSNEVMGILRERLAARINNPGQDRFLVLQAIWFPRLNEGGYEPPPFDIVFKGVAELASFRNSWGDPNGLWLGLKAGKNGFPHGHLDLGSFVLEADGVRWSRDLGSDNYSLTKYFDSGPGGQRWDYFRCNNFGHSTLALDGALQDATATAPITEFSSRPEFAYAIVDLKPAYPGKANKIRRGVAMLDGSRVLIQDEVLGASEGTMVDWRMVTDAAVALSGDGRTATLSRNGQTMIAQILVPNPNRARFVVESTPPTQSGEKSRQSIRLLKIRYNAVQWTERLAVLFTPSGGSWPSLPPLIPSDVKPLDEWSSIDALPSVSQVATPRSSPAPTKMISALSRKIHGPSGPLDLDLPITGNIGVESRLGDGRMSLVFSFDKRISSGLVSVDKGQATLASPPTFSGNVMEVELSEVADGEIRLNLAHLLADDATEYSGPFSFRVLVGDVNGDGKVSAADTSQIQQKLGKLASSSVIREDVDANGGVNSADIIRVQRNLGQAVAP